MISRRPSAQFTTLICAPGWKPWDIAPWRQRTRATGSLKSPMLAAQPSALFPRARLKSTRRSRPPVAAAGPPNANWRRYRPEQRRTPVPRAIPIVPNGPIGRRRLASNRKHWSRWPWHAPNAAKLCGREWWQACAVLQPRAMRLSQQWGWRRRSEIRWSRSAWAHSRPSAMPPHKPWRRACATSAKMKRGSVVSTSFARA